MLRLRRVFPTLQQFLFGIHEASVLRRYLSLFSQRVRSGPFSGMKYIGQSTGSAYLPKIFGTYELELESVWNLGYLRQFGAIVDVGCAEGYYLAGIGHALRAAGHSLPRLVGYDVNPHAIGLAKSLLQLNGLEAELHCRPFTALPGTVRTLLIVDIEGAETELFRPPLTDALTHADIVCEVHDEPTSTRTFDTLVSRLSPTHTIRTFYATPRRIEQFPRSLRVSVHPHLKLESMNEGRKYANRWIHCTRPSSVDRVRA
ncbi:MAG: class I SAM-dependent methyltransferase [Opitutaceae bacterium]